ncbi:hypothetical protein NC651_004195 [Populus alba x Populus x berolinensis]|nr:hypothetical protein NC651_004195 [Populus alba x Populus x berolinensis]
MQFGSDEDLSGQCSNRPEVAWAAAYCRGHFTPPQLTCDDPTRSLLGAVCSAEPKAEVNYKKYFFIFLNININIQLLQLNPVKYATLSLNSFIQPSSICCPCPLLLKRNENLKAPRFKGVGLKI